MKKQSCSGFAILILLFTLVGCATTKPSGAWEYKVVTTKIYNDWDGHYAAALNKAAVDGWEVLSSKITASDIPEQTAVQIVLKRPKK
jgi:hypothetical protein